jgi:hypothetical protein
MDAAKVLDGHRHSLLACHECDGVGCDYCGGRGYHNLCEQCRCPMGNRGRRVRRLMRKPGGSA